MLLPLPLPLLLLLIVDYSSRVQSEYRPLGVQSRWSAEPSKKTVSQSAVEWKRAAESAHSSESKKSPIGIEGEATRGEAARHWRRWRTVETRDQ